MSSAPQTTRLQRLALIALGLVLLGLGELVLRLAGLGGHPEIAIDLEPSVPAHQPHLHRLNPAAVASFFPRASASGGRLRGNVRPETFLLPKPQGTVRVLFFGESTVEGFPWPRNLTSAAFLQAWLEWALPGHRVEVLNLGATAVASFPIRKLAEQAIPRLEPDLVVLYGAHNEYFGASGQASLQGMGRSVTAMQLLYGLRGLALYQGFAELLPTPRAETAPRREQLIEVMAAQKSISPSSPLHAAARRSLERNFGTVVRLAKNRGVPVVLATVASNERDMAPLGASTGPGEADARAHFAQARAHEAAGERAAADEQYRLARDLDPMPWRAGRDKSRLLRALAEREGAALADCEAGFAAAAGGAPGWQLFDDHVHPSLAGQALLARTVLDAIQREQLLPLQIDSSPPPWQALAGALGASPLERYRVVQMMAKLFEGPPLGDANPEAHARFARLTSELLSELGPVEQEATTRWQAASDAAGEPLPIAFFAFANALRRGERAVARRYVRAALLESDPMSDVRAATHVLDALLERFDPQDRTAAETRFRLYLEEARRVEGLLGQPTALHAAALSGLYALAGDRERAAVYAQKRDALVAEQNERSEVYLAELPELATLLK